MKRLPSLAGGLAFGLALTSFLIPFGQDLPQDVTPFVRLGHQVKVSVYKDAVLDRYRIVRKGTLVREELVNMPVGSGTIISSDGLILTNHHVYQMEENTRYDRNTGFLFVAEKATEAMLVYRLKDNDPLKPPELEYIASPIGLDELHDTALLKIVADSEGNRIIPEGFPHVTIGNPFGIRLNEDILILGYPGKGGDTITITNGKFLGYYRDKYFPGIDGFIKTNAAMAPGNSGGAALHTSFLVGVPTAVTLPTQAGSDLGYIHPVTWAKKVLTIAADKFEMVVPQIPDQWFQSEYNTDETTLGSYVTGRVIAAQSNSPAEAGVIVARRDRTFEQIKALHQQLQSVQLVYMMQTLGDSGMDVESLAERFGTTPDEVNRILAQDLSAEDLDPDVSAFLEGEFFFELSQSDEDGFFILNVPRGEKVKVYVFKDGYRLGTRDFSVGRGSAQNLGKIRIYQY